MGLPPLVCTCNPLLTGGRPILRNFLDTVLGYSYQEQELAALFQTIPLVGTTPEQAKIGLESAGYHVLWFEYATVEKLSQLLANNWPVILFFHAKDLPHGQGGFHASVLVQITKRSLVLLDPVLTTEIKLSRETFQRIWSNLDCQGMVIWQ